MARAPALLVEGDDLAEVDVGEDVAGDDEEPLVELVHGVADRAGGAERRLLGGVDHPHAELGAVAEVGADGVGQEGHGDDDLVEAVPLQQADDVLHHRPVGQRQHRLRAGCEVSGRSRVPSPPAMITAFTSSRPYPGSRRSGPSRSAALAASGTYSDGGVVAEDQAGDARPPRRAAGRVRQPSVARRAARNSGKAIIRPNVPALPNQVTSMRRAPMAASTSVATATSDLPDERRATANHDGHRAVDEDGADADEEAGAGRRPGRGPCRASTPGGSGGRCSRRPSRWRRGRRAAQAAAARSSSAEQQPEEHRQAAAAGRTR